MRVEGLTRRGAIENVSFTLHAGEIMGVTGLIGAGGTALARGERVVVEGLQKVKAGMTVDPKPFEETPEKAA